MQNFKTLIQLFDYFKDEKTCFEFLENKLWDGKPVCPHCGSEKYYKTKTNSKSPDKQNIPAYKCANNKCYKKFTVTIGTIFGSSKIPLRTWFGAIYLSMNHKKGVSSCQIARDLGVTQKTGWFMLNRIREMYKEIAPIMLESVVQGDESYFGGKHKNRHQSLAAKQLKKNALEFEGKKSNAGRPTDKAAVMGLIDSENVVAKHIPAVNKDNIFPMIKANVKEGSILVTDDYKLYKTINRTLGFQHETVNHKIGEYARNGFHSNSIEGFWSQMKRGIYGVYHHASPKHLQRYCDEFAYRWNTRSTKDSERFDLVVARANKRRLKYADLIK